MGMQFLEFEISPFDQVSGTKTSVDKYLLLRHGPAAPERPDFTPERALYRNY
jgi:hypothetical protein